MIAYRRIWLHKIDDENWDYYLKELGRVSSFEEARAKYGRAVIVGLV